MLLKSASILIFLTYLITAIGKYFAIEKEFEEDEFITLIHIDEAPIDTPFSKTIALKEKIFLTGTEIKYFIEHKNESPIQVIQQYEQLKNEGLISIKRWFNLSAPIWKTASSDLTNLFIAYDAVVALHTSYASNSTDDDEEDLYTFSSGFYISQHAILTTRQTLVPCICSASDGISYKQMPCELNRECDSSQLENGWKVSKYTRKQIKTRYGVATVAEKSNTNQFYDVVLLHTKEPADYWIEMNFKPANKSDISVSGEFEVILIGIANFARLSSKKQYDVNGGTVNGKEIADFFDSQESSYPFPHFTQRQRKFISIGNARFNEDGYSLRHLVPSWEGVSGALLIIAGHEDEVIGMHVGGGIAYTVKHPFIEKFHSNIGHDSAKYEL